MLGPGYSDGLLAREPQRERHPLDAADEARPHPLDRAGELDLLDPWHEPAEDLLQLETREVRAEAEVHADAEAVVVVRRAIDAERERLLEHVRVTIRRGIEETAGLA